MDSGGGKRGARTADAFEESGVKPTAYWFFSLYSLKLWINSRNDPGLYFPNPS
jgi:hypothetical protein